MSSAALNGDGIHSKKEDIEFRISKDQLYQQGRLFKHSRSQNSMRTAFTDVFGGLVGHKDWAERNFKLHEDNKLQYYPTEGQNSINVAGEIRLNGASWGEATAEEKVGQPPGTEVLCIVNGDARIVLALQLSHTPEWKETRENVYGLTGMFHYSGVEAWKDAIEGAFADLLTDKRMMKTLGSDFDEMTQGDDYDKDAAPKWTVCFEDLATFKNDHEPVIRKNLHGRKMDKGAELTMAKEYISCVETNISCETMENGEQLSEKVSKLCHKSTIIIKGSDEKLEEGCRTEIEDGCLVLTYQRNKIERTGNVRFFGRIFVCKMLGQEYEVEIDDVEENAGEKSESNRGSNAGSDTGRGSNASASSSDSVSIKSIASLNSEDF